MCNLCEPFVDARKSPMPTKGDIPMESTKLDELSFGMVNFS